MKTEKILLTIVLYKEKLHSCQTWKTLLSSCHKHDAIALYVHDNSPEPQEITDELCVCYVHDATNCGVSSAYNRAGKYASEHDYEWILLLDQDTSFPSHTIEAYRTMIKTYPSISVLVPQLMYNNGRSPFSPVRLQGMRAHGVCLPEGIHSFKEFSVVNCGICVKTTDFMQAGGYNELVRLDFADFQFIERLKTVCSHFARIGVTAIQNFSNDEADISKLISRYEMYLDSALHCEKQCIKKHLSYHYAVLLHTLSLIKRTRKLVFFKKLFTNYFFKEHK